MADDIDPKILAESMVGAPTPQGLRKLCIDKKRCGLGTLCEHAQARGQSVNTGSFWTSRKEGECTNYFPRTELGSTGDVPRSAPTGRTSRHNLHAPPRGPERERIMREASQNGGRIPKSNLILPPHLQTPPDLGVARHIKNGRDIKKGDE